MSRYSSSSDEKCYAYYPLADGPNHSEPRRASSRPYAEQEVIEQETFKVGGWVPVAQRSDAGSYPALPEDFLAAGPWENSYAAPHPSSAAPPVSSAPWTAYPSPLSHGSSSTPNTQPQYFPWHPSAYPNHTTGIEPKRRGSGDTNVTKDSFCCPNQAESLSSFTQTSQQRPEPSLPNDPGQYTPSASAQTSRASSLSRSRQQSSNRADILRQRERRSSPARPRSPYPWNSEDRYNNERARRVVEQYDSSGSHGRGRYHR